MISRPALALLLAGSTMLAACGESAAEQEAERTEDAIEAQAAAQQEAAENAPDEEILGLTEEKLLDADLVDEDGSELGEIELVERNAMRTATGLVVELEGADPERYVVVPMRDLTPRADAEGNVQTRLSAGQLAALPDAEIDPTSDTMSGAGGT